MNITYNVCKCNKGNTFVAQDISTDSLPHQANTNNIHQYLTPDYFLPSSSNAHYYSRKYHGILNFKSRIKQVATVSLIFLSMVTGEVFAGDKRPKSKASSGRKQEVTFEAITLSNNLPDVVPQLPLPDLIPSNPPVTPPPPPPMPPLPDIVPPVILPDVVPIPPAPSMASSMTDLVSDATPQIKQKSGFLAAMKEIAKGNFKLKKVKQEQKPKVISSDEAEFMSQILARREAIAGEKKTNKFKKAAKQVIVLTAEEQKAREAEISQKIAANKEKAATLRKQKEKEWAIKAKQIEVEVEIEKQRKAAEHARAMREQKAKENGSDSNAVIAGIDPVLHNNIVADLRHEISSLKEQLSLNGNMTVGAINDIDSNDNARSKRSLEGNRIVETKDQSTSTEDLTALEDSSDTDSNNSLDTNDVVSKIVSQSNSIVSETVQDELADVDQELQSQKLKEDEEVEAVEDILSEDLMTDTVEQAGINISPVSPQEELARRANIIAKARDDLRFGSKAISKQIRHRLLTRDIGSMLAVSAGDEEQDIAPSYSIWSSGIFGGSKQKAISAALGYSSRIHGGSIGGEITFSSDLLFGVSYSRLSSKFKYLSMLDAGSNISRTDTHIFSIYNGTTLAENTNLQLLASVSLSDKHGKKQDIVTPKSKLFSFESHLNQKITWGNNITLIPSIGFRYEYGAVER
ncbi:MAG: autotransporter domain-containing protein [Rickettsia endosymbiont of Pentastiridius leporinus]